VYVAAARASNAKEFRGGIELYDQRLMASLYLLKEDLKTQPALKVDGQEIIALG
jgi:hypothetical protein